MELIRKFSFQFILLFLSVALLAACGGQKQEVPSETVVTVEDVWPEKAANMTIYEVNIRQHTSQGTIAAFTEDLPRIAELGTKMLWIMPIQPIGLKNRKGPLGSYYSIADYTAVNPEFGTMDDFKKMVEKAHSLGLFVILDWVPNHTAWDHPWITEHPEFYAKDSLGNITYEADWTDIALLDNTQPEVRKETVKAMEYWVREADIDGFRCDHAGHEIPMALWEEAIPHLDSIKDLFWLAEWDDPKMHTQFHASYYWGGHHLTKEVAKGEKGPDELISHMKEDLKKFGDSAFRLNFITNHDENAWSGTVKDLYGDAWKTFAVYSFTSYGIPMIYSGQEIGLDKKLKFFEKDPIVWEDKEGQFGFYQSLVKLREDNAALWSGIYGGPLAVHEDTAPEVLVYSRKKDSNTVLVVLNFDDKETKVSATGIEGTYTDFFTGEAAVQDGNFELPAYGFRVLVQQN